MTAVGQKQPVVNFRFAATCDDHGVASWALGQRLRAVHMLPPRLAPSCRELGIRGVLDADEP